MDVTSHKDSHSRGLGKPNWSHDSKQGLGPHYRGPCSAHKVRVMFVVAGETRLNRQLLTDNICSLVVSVAAIGLA